MAFAVHTHSKLGLPATIVGPSFLLTLAHCGEGVSTAMELNGRLVSEELQKEIISLGVFFAPTDTCQDRV